MKATSHLAALVMLVAALANGLSQPVITTEPQDQNTVVGYAVAFSVVATGVAPLSYQWRLYPESDSLNFTNIVDATNSSLLWLVTPEQPSDQWRFGVVVSNPQGAVTSVLARLVVVSLVGFEVYSSTVAENTDAVTLRVSCIGATNAQVTVDYATRDGNAFDGQDYVAQSGTLTFAPGQTNQTISIAILNDRVVENDKHFFVGLSNPTGRVAFGNQTTYVTILDNDGGLQFVEYGYGVDEGAGLATITVKFETDGPDTATVDYTTSDNDATAGVDYLAQSGTLIFGPNESVQSFTVPILNNGLVDGNRSVLLTLSNPTGEGWLGARSNVYLTILDNDTGFQFSSVHYSAWETGGVATITVLRGDDLNSAATLDYATSNGTATAGADYSARSGTLHFVAGETNKTISISVLNDTLPESPENVLLTLSNPGPGFSMGARNSAVLAILDDERPFNADQSQVKTIAAGGAHTVALQADGSLWAWGANYSGQLGNGTTESTNVPVHIGTDTDWTAVAVGNQHTLALKADGSLWAWGANWAGQLGLDGPNSDPVTIPVRVGVDVDWAAIAAGLSRSLALKLDGSLWVWGSSWSQTGPALIGWDSDWVGITVGLSGLAVKADGSLWSLDRRQIPPVPQQVGTDQDTIIVSAGGYEGWGSTDEHVSVLKADGSLSAWGGNGYGQLGDGTTERRYAPVPIGADNDWVTVTAGSYHSAGLKQDGSLWGWGANFAGQLGLGTFSSATRPAQAGSDYDWVAVTAGYLHTVALKSDGSLWAWGDNGSGQLGNGTWASTSVPVRIGSDNDWGVPLPYRGLEFRITGQAIEGAGRRLSLSFTHTNFASYFVLYRGTDVTHIDQPVDATLGPFSFQLTDPNAVSSNTTVFYRVRAVPLSHPLDLDGDGLDDGYELRHSRLLHPLNAADASGDFDGDGRSNRQEYRVGTDPTQFQVLHEVAAGINHTVVRKTDRSLWAWGDNAYGQLGDGPTTHRDTPVRIGADHDWISVTAGRDPFGDHTVALKHDGSLWAWGANYYGQLGIAESRDSVPMTNVPVRVGVDQDWTTVSAGGGITVALKRDGSLWAWGNKSLGNCCIQTPQPSPVRIGYDTDWKSVAAGGLHALALKTDGSLWAWGDNEFGQCGVGANVSFTNEPMRIGTNNIWTAIAASGDSDIFDGAHSLALMADGSLWAWGYNVSGELGLGSIDTTYTPTRVGTDTDWVTIAVTTAHSMARKRDGSLWVWGDLVADHPTRVRADNGWTAFAAGGLPDQGLGGFAVALKAEGSLWFWPLNSQDSDPHRIGSDNDWDSPP